MNHLFFFFFLLEFLYCYDFTGYRCTHGIDFVQVSEEKRSNMKYVNHPFEEHTRRTGVDSKYEPFRIHGDFGSVEKDPDLSQEKKDYLINTIYPLALEKVSELFNVTRIEGSFSLSRSCKEYNNDSTCKIAKNDTCGYSNIPIDHFEEMTICNPEGSCKTEGGGLSDVDYVLYFSAQNVGSCAVTGSSTLAFASSCVYDQYDRPITGYANSCPDLIDPEETEDLEIQKYVRVLIHEIFHALGYSYSMFKKFRFHNGTKRDNIIQEFTERGHTVKKLVTPRALEAARKHFNCSTLNGVEIEEGGGEGTELSHPDQRIFNNDLMSGVVGHSPVISEVSVAIIEDSGWYKANFDKTETQWFGKNAGCEFATEKCLGEMVDDLPEINGPKYGHFCNVHLNSKCTADKLSKGYCYILEYDSDLPEKFQYFSNKKQGGRQEVEDYCPVYEQVSLDSNCLDPNNALSTLENIFGETFGNTSKCFDSTITNSYSPGYDHTEPQGKCFEYECIFWDDEETLIKGVKISLNGVIGGSVSCYHGEEGKYKNPLGWIGSIICPENLLIYCDGELGESYIETVWQTNVLNWIITNWILCASIGGAILLVLAVIIVILSVIVCIIKKFRKKRKIYPY